LDFGFEAGDEFAVGVDERLFGFDFGDDGLLFGEWWEGDLYSFKVSFGDMYQPNSPVKVVFNL
jgi:hypothetical protein